eukprot:9299640-Pyramimonas_sp.AAC.1
MPAATCAGGLTTPSLHRPCASRAYSIACRTRTILFMEVCRARALEIRPSPSRVEDRGSRLWTSSGFLRPLGGPSSPRLDPLRRSGPNAPLERSRGRWQPPPPPRPSFLPPPPPEGRRWGVGRGGQLASRASKVWGVLRHRHAQ